MDDAKIVGYKNQNPPESSKQDSLRETSSTEVKSTCVLSSSINKFQIGDFFPQNLFLQQMAGLKRRIPKQIMSIEEKYLRHCLELIHMSAMRANSFSTQSKINFLPDRFTSRIVNQSNCDTLFLFSSGVENVTSSVDPIVGSITSSTSMINLLNSPLLNPLESITCVESSSHDLKTHHTFGVKSVHERLVSISSTNSTFSDPSSSSSSSSSSNSYTQGMLHCSWNNGFPRYVFSVEDHREVYTTNLSKIESIQDEGLDYVYMFHDNESDLVAKMKVSTSFTFCPLGTEIMETQFILCATGHQIDDGVGIPVPISNPIVKKTKGLSKKVTNIFKGHPSRNKTCSKFDGTFAIPTLELNDEGNVTPESSFPSSLESVAIVVKDRIKKVEEVGGWGLKFLKEGGDRKMHSVDCEVCRQSSSSMDVIVPAGIHGGPKVKNGGPSSLVDRWRNGGSCDCGGWDVGCPITVLNGGTNNKDVLYQEGVFGKSNSFELFTEGCKQSLPVIEVKNIHDGLYYIHYQSTLSALQSLSIAVAIIHSHSPTLKPKVYRN